MHSVPSGHVSLLDFNAFFAEEVTAKLLGKESLDGRLGAESDPSLPRRAHPKFT